MRKTTGPFSRKPDDFRPHYPRLNDDRRNEQRNGSEEDRDRSSYGNSRFRDDDFGYPVSPRESRAYGHHFHRQHKPTSS